MYNLGKNGVWLNYWTKYDFDEDDVRKSWHFGGSETPKSASWEWANQISVADGVSVTKRKQIE
jgi:hypothetical protein